MFVNFVILGFSYFIYLYILIFCIFCLFCILCIFCIFYIFYIFCIFFNCYPFRRPYFLRPGASDLRGFVQQPSFDNFFSSRLIMAPHSANNGSNLAQGGCKGYPQMNKIWNVKKVQTQKRKKGKEAQYKGKHFKQLNN